ncbi:unnamed protein product [Paramecium sonneborni]|uniref:Alpha-type protein kinase domain-containing protein n=1 Tax=Paramecium sonneborni TaxID=65129 RepID=A0A8S1Q2C9_9CILI|nr:unnamed protein product [Paramecium sonneborni]
MDQFQLEELCYENTQCHDWQCQKKHPRCFAGICIEGRIIDEENGKCEKPDCQLIHMTDDRFSNEPNTGQINGIYRDNICKNIQNCNNNNCKFLHPVWAKDYCFEQFKTNKCKKKCQNHSNWNQIRKNVYEKFDIQGMNPENICQKHNCKCDKHLLSDDFCIDYFRGICPLIECSKKHVFWEELKLNRKLQFEQPKLIPCIKTNAKNQKSLIENQNKINFMLDEEELKRMHKVIKQQNIIDIIFIMDCTKTMDPWIQQCHSQIANIIEKFEIQSKPYITRIAFVGYRDIIIEKQQSVIFLDRKSLILQDQNFNQNLSGKQILEKNHVVFHDLTDKIDSVKEFIKQQKAFGGGDEAEDVFAGIEKASQLNLSKHQDSVLITFLFADSPCHGKQYHDLDDDDFMDDVPLGTLENLMIRYRKLKFNNFFFCSRITKKTDKMFQIMKTAFPEISITDIQNPEDFPNLVVLSLNHSFSRISKSQLFKTLEIKAQSIKSKFIDYKCQTKEEKLKFWVDFTKTVDSQLRINETTIKINPNPEKILDNEDGVNSYIFKVFDVINNQNLVAKIPKKIVLAYNEQKEKLQRENSELPVQLSDELILEAQKFAQQRFQSQTIAKQLAQIYRDRVKNQQGAPPIFYVSPMLYKLSIPFYGLNYIYAETFINLPNIKWEKYSNNSNYINPQYYYYSSFSHFTYDETDRLLLITDLQGKFNIFSDPSIQTTNQYSQNLNEDKTNFNNEGIANFQGAHQKCSIICKELKLQQFSQTEYDQTLWEQNETQLLSVICETCDEYQEIKLEEYYTGFHKKCPQCKDLENVLHQVQCFCCRELFQTPINQQMRLGTVVEKCSSCKVSCLQRNLACVYCKIDCKLKVSNEKIDEKMIGLCREGRKYISSLKCLSCNSTYKYDQFLENNQYEQGIYKCKRCMN